MPSNTDRFAQDAQAMRGISQARPSKARSGTAFLVESLVLLFFLAATLAIFTNIFASSLESSANASRLSAATEVAQNAAEEFSANPQAVANGQVIGAGVAKNGTESFDVDCTVTAEKQGGGTLYTANIVVSDAQGVAYTLTTNRFAQGGAA